MKVINFIVYSVGLLSISSAFAQGTIKDKYKCADKKFAETTSEASALFKEVLGIDGIRSGKVLAENDGHTGDRVQLRIKPGRSFQMEVIHTKIRGDLPAKLCWRPDGRGKGQLIANVDGSKLGQNSTYTVTITNPKNRRDEVKMVGSGSLGYVINFDYTVTSSLR